MALRDYQADLLERARSAMRGGCKRPLLVAPTGAGKTVLSAEMLRGASERGLRSWFVVHRRELIEQTSATYKAFGISHGVVGAGFPEALDRSIQICGVQSIPSRVDRMAPPDMIVVDEAHHSVAAAWSDMLARFPNAWKIGLTATPERLDGKGLEGHYDAIVEGPTVSSLIASGYLSPYRYYAPGRPDLAGCRTSHGDYNRADVGNLMDKPKLIGDVVEHYHRHAPGQQGIVFAVSREHGQHLADAFRGEGVRAAQVDSSLPEKERRRLVEAHRAGDLDVLANVDLFGEGFDVPGIVYVGLARPTKSLALHLQQVGRGLRVLAGKEAAIICDHAGNAFVHGLPDDPRQWSLKGRAKRVGRPGANDDATPIRQCLSCYMIVPTTVRVCPCGTEFQGGGRVVAEEAGDLFELSRGEAKAKAEADKKAAAEKRKAEERACKTIGELTALARDRGYKNPAGWAFNTYSRRSSWKNKGRAA